MRQRILLAMAAVCDPELIIADELTSALDLSVKASILEYIKILKEARDMTWIFITHDIQLAKEMSQKIIVMYKGSIVEQGDTAEVLENPKHPYTISLLNSLYLIDMHSEQMPAFRQAGAITCSDFCGCPFAAQCTCMDDNCLSSRPELKSINNTHQVACYGC
jgi:oligopeptide/dipeptide ABC transporter ATP-binding protein